MVEAIFLELPCIYEGTYKRASRSFPCGRRITILYWAETRRARPLSTLSAILSLSFKDQVIAVAAAARDPVVCWRQGE